MPTRPKRVWSVVALGIASLAAGVPHKTGTEHLSVAASQSVYRGGVPHTTPAGALRMRYGPDSFFPRCLYHAVAGSFGIIRRAGFNCIHLWEGHDIADVIDSLPPTGLQLLAHWPSDVEVRRYGRDPHLLGWYLDEEPTAQTWLDMRRSGDATLMRRRYEAFLARKATINALDPGRPVFALDRGWIPPGAAAWWDRWNSSGDVSAQDQYVALGATTDLDALAGSVSRAVRLNAERKPVWVTLQAFTGSAKMDAEYRMPTPDELRGMAFTAIVHGATGLILFAYDSYVTRQGHVVGIGPATPEDGGDYDRATPGEARASRALWRGAVSLNAELARLAPDLLAPTAPFDYRVFYQGEPAADSPIRAMLKPRGKHLTLLAVNVGRRGFRVRFDLPLVVRSVVRVEQDGRRTPLVPEGTGFSDSLGVLGAAVYQLDR